MLGPPLSSGSEGSAGSDVTICNVVDENVAKRAFLGFAASASVDSDHVR